MNIIFMGTPDFAVPALKALYDSGHNVTAVFCQPDKPKGRGYKLAPPPVKVVAQEHGTPVYQPLSFKKDGEEYIGIISGLKPDCIVVAAYGKILPKTVLEIPRYGCVNIHGSLLPKYRGAAPIQRAVLDGEKETGVTTMLMNEGIDTGDILLQESTYIGKNETSAELFDRLAEMGAGLLLRTLEQLENNGIVPRRQEESEASYAPMLSKDMCPIDFSQPVKKVHNHICGLSDWPCAVTALNGKRLKVYKSEIISETPSGKQPGEIVDPKIFSVACSDGVIRFTEVQSEGSKRMKTEDYLRGKPLNGKEKLM
ncbi:methionyl-tRNA formyltransferase [Ruminococcus sp. Marseille-P6503]|uniref:methionyl-tRNA formyltransferase n=1 Tax=Ruminococcus sp. Marseille-P6503 TaxID=2364796 RepID=UPI000F527B8B|nr:methionyl-tRNA formyltransferase [Ruminococcus sp. Marseille-P6503]